MKDSSVPIEIQNLRSQVTALEQLLEVYEKTVLEQTDKLYGEISERKCAEEELNTEKNKFLAVVNAMEDGLTIQDLDYNIIYQNEAVKNVFGVRLGEKCYSTYEGKNSVCDKCPVEMVYKDGKPHISERRVVLPSGEIAFYENIASPIKDASGKFVSCLEIARNITGRKQAEADIHFLQTILMKISASKNLHDALLTTIKMICNFSGWVYGEAWIPNSDGTRLLRNKALYSSIEGFGKFSAVTEWMTFRKGVGLPGRVWSSKQPMWVHDLTLDPEFLGAQVGREVGLKTAIAFPVSVDNEVVTVIVFYQTEAKEKDERLIKFVSAAVTQLGPVIKRRQAKDALRESEARLTEAQRIAHIGNWEWDIVKNKLWWSDETYRIFGLIRQTFAATYEAFLASVHPGDREFVKKSLHEALYERKPYNIDFRIILSDGSVRILHGQGEVIFDNAGKAIKMNGTVQDITARKRTEESLRRRIDTEKIVASISTRFVKFTDFNTAVAASLADIGRLSGIGRVCLFQFCDNDSIMDNTHEWCDEGVTPEIKNLQTALFPWWMKNLHADNVIYITDVSKMPPEASIEKEFLERQGVKSLLALPLHIGEKLLGFIRLDNVITAATWQEEDVSLVRIASEIIGNAIERKQTESLINHLAYYDTLTNLPNRNLLQDRLQMAIVQAKRTGGIMAVMILDLDGFKTINDSLGHHVGDLLLKAVAERLIRCIRKGDTIARMGGDEFMVILPDLNHALNAATIANKIIHTVRQPFLLNSHKLHTTASIGISLYPLDADNKDSLIKQADIAMYLSKEHDKDTYRFFNADMNTKIDANINF